MILKADIISLVLNLLPSDFEHLFVDGQELSVLLTIALYEHLAIRIVFS
jgi:hypothetical protein